MMNNPLIQLIADGRIRTLSDLKATYHRLAMQTHPDAVGSDTLLQKFIEVNDYYEEAKGYLSQIFTDTEPSIETDRANHRLSFYRQLYSIESLEMPYTFHAEDNQQSIGAAKERAISALSEWRPEVVDLYAKADAEYVTIKREKPLGPYMKHALALNVRPLVHNIVAYHLTGQEVFARQSRQNLNAIMQKLAERGLRSLHGFITFMIEDLKNGAAVLE